MHRELKDGNRVLVGLIIIFALLIFCGYNAWKEKDSSAFWNKYIAEPVAHEVKEEEPEEETERVLDPNKPMIALTFDDGPSKYTDELLDTLELHDVKATFFLLGSRIDDYSETIQKMEDIGCEIASHTFHHYDLTKLTTQEVDGEVEWTNQHLVNVLGHGTELVRPPYGATTDEIQNNIQYPLVMWSVDTTDWQSKDASAVANHVLNVAKDGDIVLMHDIYEPTVEAVKIMIPILQERGYQIVTVSEMAKMRGVTLENGEKYFNFYK